MPVKKIRPSYEEYGKTLVSDLRKEIETPSEDEEAPTIIEEYQDFSERFSVKVVWDAFEAVMPFVRTGVILEAYRSSARQEEFRNIVNARGLTKSEDLAEQLFNDPRRDPRTITRIA